MTIDVIGSAKQEPGPPGTTSRAQDFSVSPKTEPAIGKMPEPVEPIPPTQAQRAVLDRISTEPQKSRAPTLDKLYTDVVNDIHPIAKVVKEMGGEVPTAENAGQLAQLVRGSFGKADHFLEIAPFEFNTYKNTGKGLKQILEPVRDDLDGMRAYAVSRRALELNERGIESGVPLEQARAVVEAGGKYEHAFAELQTYQNSLAKYLKDSGIVSEEGYSAMLEANKSYVPFFRLFDEGARKAGTGRGLQGRQPIKGIKGSTREIVDPIESIIKNTYLYMTLAERNAVGRSLVDLAESIPNGADFVRKVTPPAKPIDVSAPEVAKLLKEYGVDPAGAESFSIFRRGSLTPGEREIVVFRDGKREVYEVDPEVAAAFKATDVETAPLLAKILAMPARTLRAGAVLVPEFMSRNAVRDQISAFIFSKEGYIPVLDFLRGLTSIARKDDALGNWLKSGGANAAMVSLDRRYLQQRIAEISQETGLMSRAWNVAKSPLELLRISSELIENATRVGEFRRALGQQTGKEAIQGAGFKSREITLDFARIGAKMRAMNMITAFFNAQLQGLDRTVRAFKDNPVGTSAKVAVSITLPSVLLYFANRNDPRWKEIPRWQKDLFWIVMTEDHIYRIPKPFELGIVFGSLPERALEAWETDNPKAFADFEETLLNAFTPSVVPTAAVPVIEQWANRSTFTGHTLIPADLEDVLPEYQYRPYTLNVTRALGHIIGSFPGLERSQAASPIIIENYVRDWTGGLGVYAMQLADKALAEAGVIPKPMRPAPALADIPVIKAFVIRYPSASAQSIQDFYDRYGEMRQAYNSLKLAQEKGDLAAAQRITQLDPTAMMQLDEYPAALSNMRNTIESIWENPVIDPEEKRQLIDTLYGQMILIARAGNQIMEAADEALKEKAEP